MFVEVAHIDNSLIDSLRLHGSNDNVTRRLSCAHTPRFAPANERNLKQTAPIRSIVHQNWSALLDLCMGETFGLRVEQGAIAERQLPE